MVDIICYSPSPSNVYPNPASDILNVEIETEADVMLRSRGNILRSARTKSITAQFNVNSLPDGVYYLHVYNGIDNKPEITQIIVQH